VLLLHKTHHGIQNSSIWSQRWIFVFHYSLSYSKIIGSLGTRSQGEGGVPRESFRKHSVKILRKNIPEGKAIIMFVDSVFSGWKSYSTHINNAVGKGLKVGDNSDSESEQKTLSPRKRNRGIDCEFHSPINTYNGRQGNYCGCCPMLIWYGRWGFPPTSLYSK
jgi:hypothetical protein